MIVLRRRRLRLRRPRWRPWSASTAARAAPCRRGCCCPAPVTTRASSSSPPAWPGCPTATRPSDAVLMGPLVSARQRDRVLGYIEQGPGGGRQARLRRRPPGAPAQGLVRRADPVRRRRQLHDHRPGGDLRTGAGASSPTRTTTTPSASPTRATTGCRAASSRRRRSGPRRIARRIRTGSIERQRRPLVRRRLALRRLQGQRDRAPVRHRGPRAVPRDQGHRLAAADSASGRSVREPSG